MMVVKTGRRETEHMGMSGVDRGRERRMLG